MRDMVKQGRSLRANIGIRREHVAYTPAYAIIRQEYVRIRDMVNKQGRSLRANIGRRFHMFGTCKIDLIDTQPLAVTLLPSLGHSCSCSDAFQAQRLPLSFTILSLLRRSYPCSDAFPPLPLRHATTCCDTLALSGALVFLL